MDATQENSYFAELDAARLRGKELDIRAGVVAGLLNKDNLARVLDMWKPYNGKTVHELAKNVTVREEWEMLSHWDHVYWAFRDAIEKGEYIRLSVSMALYAVRQHGSPEEYEEVLGQLAQIMANE